MPNFQLPGNLEQQLQLLLFPVSQQHFDSHLQSVEHLPELHLHGHSEIVYKYLLWIVFEIMTTIFIDFF